MRETTPDVRVAEVIDYPTTVAVLDVSQSVCLLFIEYSDIDRLISNL